MEELFALGEGDVRELLTAIRGGEFSAARAVYWQCTSALLKTATYGKLEAAVEARVGRPVYFLFDELLVPESPDGASPLVVPASFQEWHRDVEDTSFAGGCLNVWLPLFTTGDEPTPLEFLADASLNAYAWVESASTPRLAMPVPAGHLRFREREGRSDVHVVEASELATVAPRLRKNTAYTFDGHAFHRGSPSSAFDLRLKIKFALSPFEGLRNEHALHLSLFALVWGKLQTEDPSFAKLDPRKQHYAAARFMHENLGARLNRQDPKERTLHQALLDQLLTEPGGL